MIPVFSTPALQALRHPHYRLFWLAQSASLFGLALQSVAEGWLVYRLTGSPLMLGLISFLPAALSAPATLAGGLLADRFDRRRFLFITHLALLVPPILLAALIASGEVRVWQVFALTLLTDALSAMVIPVRAAFILQLVPGDDLLNAQALGSLTYQLTRILGSAMGGWLIATSGEAGCYLANGLSYLAVVVVLPLIRAAPVTGQAQTRETSAAGNLLEAVRFVLRRGRLLGLYGLSLLFGLLLSPYSVLLPIYARDILRVGATGLGWLNTAGGLGALAGAVWLAHGGLTRRRWFLTGNVLAVSAALLLFAWSRSLPPALFWLAVIGVGKMVVTTLLTNLVLLAGPAEMHGRLISFLALTALGAPALGGLLASAIAERWSAPLSVTLLALAFVGGAGVGFVLLKARPVKR